MFNSIALTQERKIILAVGAVLLLLGAVYRFWPAMEGAVSVNDEIALKQSHVEKYRAIIARRDSAVTENAALKRQIRQMETRLLTGETPTLAAVEIQTILNDIAQAGGFKFATIRVVKPVEGQDVEYIRVPVQFAMNSDIHQLKEVVYQLEASSKLLIITELNSSEARSRDGRLIRSTVTVEGLMKAIRPAGPEENGSEG